ncbi:hypothetical protein HanLR1_Chr09g0301111 [Helianthus annuus]|nr:hypothetical protein HanLR1_Chr09g0301111 [Helianthus annuus]
MADTKTNEAKISIKVIVDKVNSRVVYAEADYTFVDILFSFMTLPLGTIVRLLGKLDDKKFEALGSLNNLYQSLKDFPDCYLSSEECKPMLLNPRSLSYDHCRNLQLQIDDMEPMKYFKCSNPRDCDGLLNRCMSVMDCSIVLYGGGVFVSDLATFIVTGDLCVMPNTSANIIRSITERGVIDASQLEEANFDLCLYKMLTFLKMALLNHCPFTYLIFHRIRPFRTAKQCDLIQKEVSTTSKMHLEVSLQKSTGKVLFAEAEEDFVDFLFGILSIPLGTVVGTLMNGASSISCLDNIFKSISNMSVGRYLKSQDVKDMLLKPHFGQPFSSKNQVFPLENTVFSPSTRFKSYEFKDQMIEQQLVKQSGVFMVTDDLIITPLSSYSTINIRKKLKVRLDDIERHEITIDLEEGLRILNTSLRSKSTLTHLI